jgi:indolepyruvate decarboxylase
MGQRAASITLLIDNVKRADGTRFFECGLAENAARTASMTALESGAQYIPIGVEALYPRWANFLKPDDILVAETGTASMGLGFAQMPKGATFHNQTLWGSIGWATPASFGAAVAAPKKRIVLVTGDGSHQLTVQEISQFGRLDLKPVVFVLNNDGYLIERLLCKEPAIAYNDIAPWHYADLPHAFGCDDWQTARVTTCEEFDRALQAAEKIDHGRLHRSRHRCVCSFAACAEAA